MTKPKEMSIDIGALIPVLVQIVSWGDEIRKNYAARGAEAEAQFEEAVGRNKVSFAQMLSDLGGYPQQPPDVPPVDEGPTDPPGPWVPPVDEPPPVTPSNGAQYNEAILGDLPTDTALKGMGYKAGDRKYVRATPMAYLLMKPLGQDYDKPSWPMFYQSGVIS